MKTEITQTGLFVKPQLFEIWSRKNNFLSQLRYNIGPKNLRLLSFCNFIYGETAMGGRV